MKKIILPAFVFVFSGMVSCKNITATPKVINIEQTANEKGLVFAEATKLSMSINGMVCAHGCAAVIEKNLNKTTGIKEAKVDFETKQASLIYDAALLNPEKVSEVVFKAGDTYSVSNVEVIN
jgi:Cu+-exporting ATPase